MIKGLGDCLHCPGNLEILQKNAFIQIVYSWVNFYLLPAKLFASFGRWIPSKFYFHESSSVIFIALLSKLILLLIFIACTISHAKLLVVLSWKQSLCSFRRCILYVSCVWFSWCRKKASNPGRNCWMIQQVSMNQDSIIKCLSQRTKMQEFKKRR